MKLFTMLVLSLFGVLAASQTASPAPSVAAVVGAINNATAALPSSVPTGLILVLGFIISELGMHGIPTSKPISWFLLLESIVGGVVLFLQKLQGLLNSLGTALQNTTSS